jgi:hypothetical protein
MLTTQSNYMKSVDLTFNDGAVVLFDDIAAAVVR